MKTTIGGDRLGSGSKQEVSLKTYSRSSHDMSYLWRSTMSSGTLVPFMSQVALPGDNWNIDLDCDVKTLPTVGPLFGSYKIQLDVFCVPVRLYNAGLHMNRLGIGNNMSEVKLPKVAVRVPKPDGIQTFDDNSQINSSCIFKYLGISGIGELQGTAEVHSRNFNAVPYLGYWDIYKNYYANKQEERGFVVHTTTTTSEDILEANLFSGIQFISDILDSNPIAVIFQSNINMNIVFDPESEEPNPLDLMLELDGQDLPIASVFGTTFWNSTTSTLECSVWQGSIGSQLVTMNQQEVELVGGGNTVTLKEFPLDNIDTMRDRILQYPFADGEYVVNASSQTPYQLPMQGLLVDSTQQISAQYTQEGLGIKTYQSDLFNNWISTEWIDGTNGINEITSVSTVGDEFTIDALNLASKVYNMLNRIAISGGSYDDWLDAVYTHERSKSAESPVYHGSLIKELGFEEVISNNGGDANQPLGTLAGRGRMMGKNKGGKISIKVDEPSYIMGIASITPRIDYSQGNQWDVNLDTLNDLHKPALDGIGYQDLITEQMCWSDTTWYNGTATAVQRSAGKQPAWINYMTNVNKVYGGFAEENNSMFMTLNRRYEKNTTTGRIEDLTTYIDPTKYNNIFAQTSLDSQNFWMQISCDITARRKMSAKIIPNL